MHVELIRDKAITLPPIPDSQQVTSLCVWHCNYQTLSAVSELQNLRVLKIATFPDNSVEFLHHLDQLEWLSILHLPKVKSLASIAALRRLRFLELATLPSWDASSKRTVVESLGPLTLLSRLEHISLIGVTPASKSLVELQACEILRSGNFHGYPKQEVARFFATSGITNQHIPQATISA